MAKLRSISTAFWSDPFIEELNANQKLLFLYLVTNEKTNMLGVYEMSIKKISFETGIEKKQIIEAFNLFEEKNKLKYFENFVIIRNFTKHQNFNTNMKKSAIEIFLKLPNQLGFNDIELNIENVNESFETLSKALVTLSNPFEPFRMVRKEEIEYEYELETEKEKEIKKELEIKIETKKDFFDFELILKTYNQIFNRNFKRYSANTTKKYNNLKKLGFTTDDIFKAMINVKNTKLFAENNYQYATLEYFSREKTMEMFAGIEVPSLEQQNLFNQNEKRKPTASEQLEQFKSRMVEKLRAESQSEAPEFEDQGYATDVYD
jgi:hypothetical protein